ncbi:MAG: efflux RND transporter periplasmic adaptor subunit [gamma proteobacterium symbiont of Bathyaustriella thionipta]|nr:efflux RND transporter periplasmic adaptor subunit [gamma proteobacterium symbiont of Bathyaustriella thionipta]MCU7949672.1 efflux RND transporter periplasmic adaptor subunit [gamma proteobacterium symbiont of Bathyaustriella thionipta]MCU7952220.1 efflux RND transporter periplasmic adaptor subunit [gamma proteobacterium symbiont of Bathyaustriella thionipta]MCU7956267.1 efflux RND transporter periplasmic adaptor subunit [gamma proteobacterium symbiont of Bathyaustriella thionipta]MCU796810
MKFYYLLSILLTILFSSAVSAQEQHALSVVPIKSHSIPAARLFVGGTVAAHKSVAFSAQMPGRITIISGEEGDHFKRGDLLVKINDDELLARRQTALAQFATASIAVNNAGVQYHRQIRSPSTSNNAPGGMGMPGMFDQLITNPMSEMMGTREYDVERGADIFSARARLDQAHQAREQARSQIQQIDTKLRDTWSIAPFDGVIVTKNIEVGDTVQPGQTLLVYEDLEVLQIVIDVPGRLIHNLTEGQSVIAQIDGLNDKILVKVSKIFPTSDPVRHTTRVKLTLPASNQISPGNYAQVWIPVSKDAMQKRLLAPASAVIERGGIPSIFVVNKQNQAELRLVRVGEQLPSGHIVILYGVKENERVLDKPPAFITSGYVIK